jgi:hypothetical protein
VVPVGETAGLIVTSVVGEISIAGSSVTVIVSSAGVGLIKPCCVLVPLLEKSKRARNTTTIKIIARSTFLDIAKYYICWIIKP